MDRGGRGGRWLTWVKVSESGWTWVDVWWAVRDGPFKNMEEHGQPRV